VGELYLEKHQGTFTTNAATKKGNRKMEVALRELELVSVQLMLAEPAAAMYPHGELRELWREVLLYQFHDILPGSSIKRVYDECEARYAEMLYTVGSMTERSRGRLLELSAAATAVPAAAAVVLAVGASSSAEDEAPAMLWNTLSWERTEWIQQQPDSSSADSSAGAAGRWMRATVPALGGCPSDDATATAAALAAARATLIVSADTIENECVRVRFDSDGSILSIIDKQHGDREVLAPSAGHGGGAASNGNRLAVFLDDGDACESHRHFHDAVYELLHV
jgi:alpha-mannosidase